jgi:hypothetical protein
MWRIFSTTIISKMVPLTTAFCCKPQREKLAGLEILASGHDFLRDHQD